ncbi:MAG: hypothetical protein JWQ16_994 [Novosphingobium sp.]|nr:hypothetical protein [Novosphingobium sp.]
MSMMALPDRRAEICRSLMLERRLVAEWLGARLDATPVWDMLLDLYLAQREGRSHFQKTLALATNVSQSTAYDWIVRLAGEGYVTRAVSNDDKRRIEVTLTPTATARLDIIIDALASRCEVTFLGGGGSDIRQP